ncbi:MAG: ParA family protein [Nanoarchaeota archaeon]
MRKICVINQKGGVGKTTTTANIAYGLADAGKKVLVVDLDPQGNISQYFPVQEQNQDVFDVLVGSAELYECIQEVDEYISVLPSRETLTKAELMMAGEPGREGIMSRKLAGLSGYDYILIDCAPSLGLLNQNAMLFANEAFIPVSTDYLGVEGLKKIMAAMNTINDVFEHDLQITKVIPTMFDARVKHCKESLARIQNEFYEAATNPIRINSKLKDAPKYTKSIFELDRRSNGAKDYRQLVNHIIQDEEKYAADAVEESVEMPIREGGMVLMTF